MNEEKKTYKTQIIPYAYPQDEKGIDKIGIAKMSITYVQQDDTNHGVQGDEQTITISTEDVPCTEETALNEKGGYYFVIKTNRWAVDNTSDLETLLNDFRNRLQIQTEG